MLKVAELGLLKVDLVRGLNLFVGAGFSTLARNALNEALPQDSPREGVPT